MSSRMMLSNLLLCCIRKVYYAKYYKDYVDWNKFCYLVLNFAVGQYCYVVFLIIRAPYYIVILFDLMINVRPCS